MGASTGFAIMASRRDLIGAKPPRMPSPGERAILADWLAMAGDVASAHVSMRRTDDPILYGTIVVAARAHPDGDTQITHLVYQHRGANHWEVCALGGRVKIRHFQTLNEALNSIHRVLPASTDPVRGNGQPGAA
jgi:hypothetical protein